MGELRLFLGQLGRLQMLLVHLLLESEVVVVVIQTTHQNTLRKTQVEVWAQRHVHKFAPNTRQSNLCCDTLPLFFYDRGSTTVLFEFPHTHALPPSPHPPTLHLILWFAAHSLLLLQQ